MEPGRAIKQSERRAISAFLWCIFATAFTSPTVSPVSCTTKHQIRKKLNPLSIIEINERIKKTPKNPKKNKKGGKGRKICLTSLPIKVLGMILFNPNKKLDLEKKKPKESEKKKREVLGQI